jgi:hypothetical protein
VRTSKKGVWQPKESTSQSQLFDWAKWAQGRYPELDLMFAVPNGFPLHGPQRYAVVNYMKAQGLKNGVPDISLPIARGGYFGKWIEMKVKGGRLSEEQQIWIPALRNAGGHVSVCESFDEAVADLEAYLQLPQTVVA